jgi:hypothetical protein
MLNLYRLPTGLNINRGPIGCAGLTLSLFGRTGNPKMNDPVLLAEYHSISGGQEARTERRRSFLIKPSLHMLHKVSPPLGGEINARTRQAPDVTLTKIQRPHRRFLCKSDDRGLVCFVSSSCGFYKIDNYFLLDEAATVNLSPTAALPAEGIGKDLSNASIRCLRFV